MASLTRLFLGLSVLSYLALSWGPLGHQLTANVAKQLISTSTLSAVTNILGDNDMADAANWADQIKSNPAYAWSKVLHYVNTPDWECAFTPDSDCDGNKCVVGAIQNYTSRLTKNEQTDEALKFILHFVGDIHQPLHVAFASDEGGNTYHGTFYDDTFSLHMVWDDGIINQRITQDFSGSSDDWMSSILQRVQSGDFESQIAGFQKCPVGATCVDQWASETAKLACQYAYVDSDGNQISDGFDLGEAYYQNTVKVVETQLVKGGARLAALLDSGVFSRTE